MTNEQIESVAKRICEELGLNPNQTVYTTSDGIMTSKELFFLNTVRRDMARVTYTRHDGRHIAIKQHWRLRVIARLGQY